MRKRLVILACLVGVYASVVMDTPAEPGAPVPAKALAVPIPANALAPATELPPGWTTVAPRDEVCPKFSFDQKGGPNGTGSIIIQHDDREGLHGWVQKTFEVTGGKHYKFSALRKVENVG